MVTMWKSLLLLVVLTNLILVTSYSDKQSSDDVSTDESSTEYDSNSPDESDKCNSNEDEDDDNEDNSENDDPYVDDGSEHGSDSDNSDVGGDDDCGLNEVLSNCTNGGCGISNCSQIGQGYICKKIRAEDCKKGCVCKKGYLRAANYTCVPKDQCDVCCGDENAIPGCGIYCNNKCSTYKTKDEICITQCKENGCDCKKGYVYDENTKKCTKPKKCTPVCGDDEVFNSCVNADCKPQNCSQLGKSIPCPRIDPAYCKPGCLCKEEYLRASNGTCVPKNDCDTCGGDKNARPGCGTYCGTKCSNYKNKNAACSLVCLENGCDCKPGYVLDDNKKICVKPDQCTSPCGKNEKYSTCCNAVCRPLKCSQKGQSVACPKLAKKECKKGCICKKNYLKDKNGTCVKENQCDPHGCPNGEVKLDCPPTQCEAEFCPRSSNYSLTCPPSKECYLPRCVCGFNRLRNRTSGECIARASCPPFPCDGPNEKYDACPPVCPGQKCIDYLNNSTCSRFRIGIVVQCRPQCRCEKGFYRSSDGVCVDKDQCETNACPEGEVFSTCPPTYEAEYCPKSRNDSLNNSTPKFCGKGRCVCGFNSRRDRSTGKCIPTYSCPPFPCDGQNEAYNSCPPVCPGQNCSDYLNNSTCPKYRIGIVVPCKPQCRCVDNTYRNSDGICVSGEECENENPKKCRGKNEYFEPCVNTCSPETCASIGKIYHCLIQPTYCTGACRCRKDFYRNDEGECIPKSDCPVTPNSDDDASDEELKNTFLEANKNFTILFLKALRNENRISCVSSPSSLLSFMLPQLLPFTSGGTYEQLQNIIKLRSKKQITQVIPPLLKSVKSDNENVTCSLAAKVYSTKRYPLKEDFLEFTRDVFEADAEALDFSQNEDAADTINKWVEDHTNKRIKNLISPDMLDGYTRLVLVNAIYFVGTWKKQFDVKNTKNSTFYKEDNEIIDIPTMHIKDKFKYSENAYLDSKLLEISYLDDQYKFVVILPNSKNGIDEVLAKLMQPYALTDAIKSMSEELCEVSLPKFKIETSVNLAEILKFVNVTDLFDSGKAEIHLLEEPESLYVTQGIHKAFFVIKEEGSEAAAVNGLTVSTTAAILNPPPVPIFKADHPFIFFILSNNTYTNYPLFCGIFEGNLS